MSNKAQQTLLASRAFHSGAHYCRIIVEEAERVGIPVSLGFALIGHESSFQNIYGHDPVSNPAPKGGLVTKVNYLRVYLPNRPRKGMQGVGPGQLTWYATQDSCTKYGGCWDPRANIRVAFQTLAQCIKDHGYSEGIARYNGSGTAAHIYSSTVRAMATAWHAKLVR